MSRKRVTIYDLAKELGISASYISKALNNHPSISEKTKLAVKKKAAELNYKQNTHAANLRQGSSKTIGVIVPHIDQRFFSDVFHCNFAYICQLRYHRWQFIHSSSKLGQRAAKDAWSVLLD